MTNNSHIEQLIQNLCPNGVKYMPLEEVLDYEQPTKYIVKSTEYNDAYKTPVLTAGQGFILGYTNETDGIYKASKANPTIIFDDFTTSYHWVDFNFKVKSSAMKMLRPRNNNLDVSFRYVYYAMLGIDYSPSEHSRQWISKYALFTIPLPPLPIQEEIVRTLDAFANLIENIDTEIKERERQLELTREAIFSNVETSCSEWSTLGQISKKVVSGGTPSRKVTQYFNGDIPWLRTQEIDWKDVYDTEIHITEEAVRNSAATIIPANCLIIAMYGATAGKACINRIPLTTNQACCNLVIDRNRVFYKYAYYWVCKEYLNIKGMGEGSQDNINGQKVKSYPIPLPSLAEQRAIAEKLDTIEALIANLKTERDLRQQQYEYYREHLINLLK